MGKDINYCMTNRVDTVSGNNERVCGIKRLACGCLGICGVGIIDRRADLAEVPGTHSIGWDRADIGDTLPYAGALIIHEEERAVVQNGSAQQATELIALERRALGIKEISGVQFPVTEELIDSSVKFIRPRPQHHVNSRPAAAEFGLIEVSSTLNSWMASGAG